LITARIPCESRDVRSSFLALACLLAGCPEEPPQPVTKKPEPVTPAATAAATGAPAPSLPPDADTTGTPACLRAQEALEAELAALDRGCQRDADCVSVALRPLKCSAAVVVSKRAADSLAGPVLDLQNRAREACREGEGAAPCTPPVAQPACVVGRCRDKTSEP